MKGVMSSGLTLGKGTFLYKGTAVAFFVVVSILGIFFLQNGTFNDIGSWSDFFNTKDVGVNGLTLHVLVAKTPEEQTKSLNDLASMPRRQGMIFVFDGDGHYGFSSKDMQFPVDVIWLDKNGDVVDTQINVAPGLQYPVLSTNLARYVLVVNAGVAFAYDIVPRTHVYLPDLN